MSAVESGPIERTVDDARARVVGTFPFAVDRRVEGAAHIVAVRSQSPHARILGIDAAPALELPGVLAVVTGDEVRDELGEAMFHGENRKDQPVLAVDRVRFVGEPVALVVAETRQAAEQATRYVDVDLEELPYVTNQDEAGEPDAPRVHDEWAGNDCGEWQLVHGDAEEAMKSAAVVDTQTYHSPTASHAALEPHVATASWIDGADGAELEIWSGTQAPYEVRKRLSGIFGLDPERIRIRVDNIGGGFGGKLDLKLEAMAAVCSRRIGRPARMELRRDEVFATAAKHSATVTITTGADTDGRMVARIIDVVYNGGAYALSTPRSIRSGMIRSPGPYAIPHVYVRARGRYTNTVPTGPFRGAMTGQVCFAHESALDELAELVGIDPLEIRRRNILRDGSTFATGEVMHEMKYAEVLDELARGIGWDEPLPEPVDGVVRGRGIGLVLKSTRTPSRSEADVVLRPDGSLVIRSSSVEMGQGAHRTLCEMVAAQLDVDPSAVSVTVVDTDHTPFDTVTSSSRTTLSMGLAVEAAARDLRDKVEKTAAAMGELDVSLAAVAAEHGELVGHGTFESAAGYGVLDPETSQGLHTVSWHQGGVAVEVEVDTRTGRVRVVRAHGVSFAGRAIDPERIRKQTEGGMIFALGQALMEEVVFDAGELANANLSDYQLPSILDAPVEITSAVLSDPDPNATPHGVGENTVPPIAPAIANAVYAATGARVRELPLTAERVLKAIRETGANGEKERS